MPEKKLLPRRIRVLGSVAAAVVLVGLQLAGAGTANAKRELRPVIKSGLGSANYSIAAYGLEGAKSMVNADIDRQCKKINSKASATNFTYRPGGSTVHGYGDCVL